MELQVGGLSHEFIVDSGANYFLIEEAAQKRATTLFGQLVANNSNSSIESLTDTFLVIILVKRWGSIVTRKSGKGGGFVVEKRFVGTDALPEVTLAGFVLILSPNMRLREWEECQDGQTQIQGKIIDVFLLCPTIFAQSFQFLSTNEESYLNLLDLIRCEWFRFQAKLLTSDESQHT